MRKAVYTFFIIVFFHILHASGIYEQGYLSVNKIQFNFHPEVKYRTPVLMQQSLTFTETVASYTDSCIFNYSNQAMDITLKLTKTNEYYSEAWLAQIDAVYHQDIIIQDIILKLDFNEIQAINIYKGVKAINTQSSTDNRDLCPYTDKAIEYYNGNSGFWIVGSNYKGCNNIEWIKNNSISLYDHTLHFARLYNQTNPFLNQVDTMPRNSGQTDSWSFLVFSQKPYLLSINRWLKDKKAAFAITNDADGETEKKLKAVYFGSSNTHRPKYMSQGLAANDLVVSNTVFGVNNFMGSLWSELMSYGNTIGYHTYTTYSDITTNTKNSLLTDMHDYNVRLWIDHCLPNNPEDFGMSGGDINSPYYILDTINKSDIKYAWLGDTPNTNPFNLFDDPWRLPHLLFHFSALTKPVWFFGRTRMEAWENTTSYNQYCMKPNLTTENLDNLIAKNGLCIAYTHFSFNEESPYKSFFDIIDNQTYEVKDEVNDRFIMLDMYQKQKGLWIDTVENIFDRMLAIEQVQIVSVEDDSAPGFIRITLENTSDYALKYLYFTYNSTPYIVQDFDAHARYSFIINKTTSETSAKSSPFLLSYRNGNVYLKSNTNNKIPPMNLHVYNIKGQLVAKELFSTTQDYHKLLFRNKSSGIYIAHITMEGVDYPNVTFTVIK